MRIHTNATRTAVENIVTSVPGVAIERLSEHRSTTHARAFELNLSGSGRYGGQFGMTNAKSATWDEWGVVMAAIFEVDPQTRMGGSQKNPVYRDGEDFVWQTAGRFAHGTPEDMRPGHIHRWTNHVVLVTGTTRVSCKKCSAERAWSWA